MKLITIEWLLNCYLINTERAETNSWIIYTICDNLLSEIIVVFIKSSKF